MDPVQPHPSSPVPDDQLIAAALQEHGEQGVWWIVKRLQSGTRIEQIVPDAPGKVHGLEFDELEYARVAGPGDYIRRLKVKGHNKTFTEERFSVAARSAPPPAPIAAAAGGASSRDDVLMELLREVRALRERPATPPIDMAATVITQVGTLIGALTPLMKPAQQTPLKEYLEGLQLVRAIQGDNAAPEKEINPLEWAQAIKEVAPLVRDAIAARARPAAPPPKPVANTARPPSPALPAPQPSPAPSAPAHPEKPTRQDDAGRESSGGGATSGTPSDPPPPAQSTGTPEEEALVGQLDAAAKMLLAAGRREGSDPSCYAGLVDDTLAACGMNAAELVAGTEQGQLTEQLVAMRPELGEVRAWLVEVESELRELVAEEVEDDDEPPPAAAALKPAA